MGMARKHQVEPQLFIEVKKLRTMGEENSIPSFLRRKAFQVPFPYPFRIVKQGIVMKAGIFHAGKGNRLPFPFQQNGLVLQNCYADLFQAGEQLFPFL